MLVYDKIPDVGVDDRFAMREFYDLYGDAEWLRLQQDPHGRVTFEVHRRFLARFIKPGMNVLEVGAGPSWFTLELATLGHPSS
jgi:hypothetical protein